jgi:hypothetical protein
MSSDEILYLQDLASTVMNYLDTYTLRDQHHRGAERLEGLITFAQGDLNMQLSVRIVTRHSSLQELGRY